MLLVLHFASIITSAVSLLLSGLNLLSLSLRYLPWHQLVQAFTSIFAPVPIFDVVRRLLLLPLADKTWSPAAEPVLHLLRRWSWGFLPQSRHINVKFATMEGTDVKFHLFRVSGKKHKNHEICQISHPSRATPLLDFGEICNIYSVFSTV